MHEQFTSAEATEMSESPGPAAARAHSGAWTSTDHHAARSIRIFIGALTGQARRS
jgi:hypothetical protein